MTFTVLPGSDADVRVWRTVRKPASRLGEPYWFGVAGPNPEDNARELGSIRAWARHDKLKQRGFYVELGTTGEVLAPPDVADEERLRNLTQRVHQIGWQLRLG